MKLYRLVRVYAYAFMYDIKCALYLQMCNVCMQSSVAPVQTSPHSFTSLSYPARSLIYVHSSKYSRKT